MHGKHEKCTGLH